MADFIGSYALEILCGEKYACDTMAYISKILKCTHIEGVDPLSTCDNEYVGNERSSIKRLIARAYRNLENCRIMVVRRYVSIQLRK